MRLAQILLVAWRLVFAADARAGEAPGEHTESAQPHAAAPADAERCRTLSNVLPIVPLVVEWQEEDRPRRLTLGADGAVRSQNTLIARVSNSCILGSNGNVWLSIDRDLGVSGAHRERVGRIKKSAELRVDDDVIRVDEIFVDKDGVGTAVDSQGALYLVPTDGPAFSLPGMITGDIPRARRTALLLWQIAHRP